MNKDAKTCAEYVRSLGAAPPFRVQDAAQRLLGARLARTARRKAKPKHEAVKRDEGRRTEKKATKKSNDAAVYRAVRERDAGFCSVQLPAARVGECSGRLTIDHQWGRGKAPTLVENCRQLCAEHHRRKTDSEPDRLTWLEDFKLHALDHGYYAEIAKVDAIADLEAAQHPERHEVKP